MSRRPSCTCHRCPKCRRNKYQRQRCHRIREATRRAKGEPSRRMCDCGACRTCRHRDYDRKARAKRGPRTKAERDEHSAYVKRRRAGQVTHTEKYAALYGIVKQLSYPTVAMPWGGMEHWREYASGRSRT